MYSDGKPIRGGLLEFSKKCNKECKLYPKHDLLEWDKSSKSYKFKDLEDWEEKVAVSKRASTDNAHGNAKKRRKSADSRDTSKGKGLMATCTKCKATCPSDMLEDPHCPVCHAMLPNEGLTKELIEQKKLPKEEAAGAKAADKTTDAAKQPADDTVEGLTESLKVLSTMAENDWNKQLKAGIEERIKDLQAVQAVPASTTAKQKVLDELLNSKKIAEGHGFSVHKDHAAQIKKLQAEIDSAGKESRSSLLKTAAKTAETLRKLEEKFAKMQAHTLQLHAQWDAAHKEEEEFSLTLG